FVLRVKVMHGNLPPAVLAPVFVLEHAATHAGIALRIAEQFQPVPATLGGFAVDREIHHRVIKDLRMDLARLQSLMSVTFVREQVLANRLGSFYGFVVEDEAGIAGNSCAISFHSPYCEYCA